MDPKHAQAYLLQMAKDFCATLPVSAQAPTYQIAEQCLAALASVPAPAAPKPKRAPKDRQA